MSDKYSFEEISEEDGGMMTLGNDELRLLVAKSLSNVPKEVADRVLTGCVFIMPMSYYEDGLFIPKDFLKNKTVIAFPEKILKISDKKAMFHIVLHEIAHFYLDHKSQIINELSPEEAERQEEEADRLADQWLSE